MYPSVANSFWSSVAGGEGVTRWPYLDDKGLVSAAMGLLLDFGGGHAPPQMLALPWKIEAPGLDARKATNAEIEAGWQAVKAKQEWKGSGGGQSHWANLTNLRLDDDAIHQATIDWLRNNEPTLRASFPGYDTMPADGQLALLGMSYAMGPGFATGGRYPKFRAAVNAVVPDYLTAAAESSINQDVNSAIEEHNATNRQLFLNAANAYHSKTPFSVLWWPENVDPGGTGASASLALKGPVFPRRALLPSSIFGRIALAAGAVTAGMLGVSMVQAHRRGEAWTAPIVRIERSAERFGRSVDVRVRKALSPGKRERA